MLIEKWFDPIPESGDFKFEDVLFSWDHEAKKLSFMSGAARVEIINGIRKSQHWYEDDHAYIQVFIDGLDLGFFSGATFEITDARVRQTVEFALRAWFATYQKTKDSSLDKLADH